MTSPLSARLLERRLALQPGLKETLDATVPARAFFATTAFKDRSIEEQVWTRMEESVTSGMRGVVMPCQRSTLAAVGEDALMYGAISVDASRGLEQISTGLGGGGAEWMQKPWDTFWAGLEMKDLKEIHWKEEILDQVGPEFGLTVEWKEPSLVPSLTLIMEVKKDRTLKGPLAGMEKLFQLLQKQWGASSKIENIHGPGNVRICALRNPATKGWLAPSFAMTDQFMIVSANLAGLDSSLRALMRIKPGLAERKEFKEAEARFPKGYYQFVYCDEKRLFERAYNMASPLISMMNRDAAAMPRTDDIAKHLFPGVWVAGVDAQGYHQATSGPISLFMVIMNAIDLLTEESSAIPGK